MTQIAIRQSGGANIVSLPKAILKILGLHVGSVLNLSIENSKIVLDPAGSESLEDLLSKSPKEKLAITLEDKEWMSMKSVGKEVL